MAGRQRTFELIPTTLVKSNENVPVRMTSKAVKKAYQQKNKVPRISKAEQRRLEAEESARQKKEYEREKAAAKAKAAREKKAAKEIVEKESRKKAGLPEPSRFVRASQPTISKFVRGAAGGKRTWEDMQMVAPEEESDDTLADMGLAEKDDAEPPTKRVAVDADSDDEFGDFPSSSQLDLLEKIDSSMLSVKEGDIVPGPASKRPNEQTPQEPSQKLPQRKSSDDEYPWDDSQAIADLANTQLLSEAADAAQRSDPAGDNISPSPQQTIQEPTHPKKPSPTMIQHTVQSNVQPSIKRAPVGLRAPLKAVSPNMPPPLLPPNGNRTISFATTPQKPMIPLRKRTESKRKPNHNLPPSATQAFLASHFDDFFPSPTQEIRELLSDVDDLPSNTQISRELSPERPVEVTDVLRPNRIINRGSIFPNPVVPDFDDLICTQDLVLSSQELHEFTTPSRAPIKAVPEPEVPQHCQPPKEKPRFFEEKEEDILLAVIEKSKKETRLQVPVPQNREKKRTFFEEKEEDLLAAALSQSKKEAQRQSAFNREIKEVTKVASVNQRKERGFKRVASTATDYGDDDFSSGELEELGF